MEQPVLQNNQSNDMTNFLLQYLPWMQEDTPSCGHFPQSKLCTLQEKISSREHLLSLLRN